MADSQSNAHSRNFRDLTGLAFGRWIVVEYAGRYRGYGGAVWKCRCQCGKEKLVRAEQLTGGGSKSCGCIGRELLAERNRKGAVHGLTNSPEYNSWMAMKARCYNPTDKDFHRYGARGITVCKRWLDSFVDFLADMGPRPSLRYTIDRYPNNDGNYEPDNCRWALPREQSNNRRSNRLVIFRGRTQTLAEWCRELGLVRDSVAKRLADGWSAERALSTPIRQKRKRHENLGS